MNELMNHLKNVQEHVNVILNNKHSFTIFQLIEERFKVYTLGNDWKLSEKTVDILEEARRLSYIISDSANSLNELCDYDYAFELINNRSLLDENNYEYPNNKQKLFFYFNSNILNSYKLVFESLSEECAISLEKMWKDYQNIHLIFNIIVVIILVFYLFLYI